MDLDNYESIYEHNLRTFIKSQQLQIQAKIDNNEKLIEKKDGSNPAVMTLKQ